MKQLIADLKRKDKAAFEKVMALYKHRIFNYLRLLVRDDALAEELTQDTFVKVYFKAHTLRSDNLKSWIYTIATNLARSVFRKKRITFMFSLDDVDDRHLSFHSTVEDTMTLEQALADLPEKYRVPVVMKEIENFTFEEIAGMMNKPVGTIKTLVFRGKNRMRDQASAAAAPSVEEIRMLEREASHEITG